MSDMSHHPVTALVPYVRNELTVGERARVAAHLDACDECRHSLADVQAVLGGLAAAPTPAEPHWGRYRAELRARIDGRGRGPRWWRRPMPIAVSTGLAAALLLFTLRPAPVEQRPAELTPLDETTIGARLDMLEHYDVVQRLDLLEELDVIRQLDRLPVRGS
jgi:anti-sigma factor RsiW